MYLAVSTCYVSILNSAGGPKLKFDNSLVIAPSPRHIGKFQQILRPNTFLIESRHPPAVALFLQVPKLCTDLDPTLLYILK